MMGQRVNGVIHEVIIMMSNIKFCNESGRDGEQGRQSWCFAGVSLDVYWHQTLSQCKKAGELLLTKFDSGQL